MSTTVRTTAILPLSQSRYEDMACPILYTTKHVEGLREPNNEYALRGTQVHAGLSDYTRYLRRARLPLDRDWFEMNVLTRPYLSDALNILRDVGGWFTIDPDTVLDTELYLALDQDFQPIEAASREEYFEATGRYPDHEGTLDLVLMLSDTAAQIPDYKTFFRIVDADSFQSHFYPLLLMKHYRNLQTVEFVLQFARYGERARRSVVYTREDLPKLETMAREARLRQIQLHMDVNPNPDPMSGDHCAFCPKLRTCPLGDRNAMTESPADVLRRALWAQALLKHDKKLLMAHTALEPICTTDGNGTVIRAGFVGSNKTFYSIEALPIVGQNDPALLPKLKLSELGKALKAKKRAGLRELVEPFKEVKVGSKFTLGASEEEGEEE